MFNTFKPNKLKKFFEDKQKVTTQFKALYSYGSSASQEERKQFHQKNYRRVFSVCRNALDEYSKRNVTNKKSKDDDSQIKDVAPIIAQTKYFWDERVQISSFCIFCKMKH